MYRLLNLVLLLLVLLAAWSLWPTVRTYEPSRMAASNEARTAIVHRVETPRRAVEEARVPIGVDRPESEGDGMLARVGIRVPRSGRARLVRIHGVVRRAGRPVAGYDLAFRGMGLGLDDDEEEWDFTNDDGTYMVMLPAGSYVVLNDDDGPWRTNVYVTGDEDEIVLDIDLPPGAIRGHVRREGGEAVSGAMVYALRSTPHTKDVITQGLMARGGEVVTRPDGSFELADLGPGDYLVMARDGELLAPPLRVRLRDEPVAGVSLVLDAGYTLEGVVRGSDGAPVTMDLYVCPGRRVVSLAQLEAAREHYTKRDGSLAVAGLQPGAYTIFAAGDTDTHDMALQATIDFRPGEPVVLEAKRCGSLFIVVARSDGLPIPGAYLDIRADDGNLVMASLEWLEYGPTSDDEGRVELDDVMPGSYRIAAGWGGRLGAPARVEVRSEETTEVRLLLE